MPSRLLGRLKRLETKILDNKPPLLLLTTQYGETRQEAEERFKEEMALYEREYKGPKPPLIIITNFGDYKSEGKASMTTPVSNFKNDKKPPENGEKQLQKQIDAEIEAIKKHGFTESEIEKAVGIADAQASIGDGERERTNAPDTRNNEPGLESSELSRLMHRHHR